MKKFLSLLLTVTMLLTMIPSVIVNVSAADTVDGTWSISSDLTTLTSGTYVIPTTVKSATLNGSALNVNIPLDSYSATQYDSGAGIATGAFEIIGEFDGARTVSNFIIQGHWKYSQQSDFMVSLRKAETGEWVTITPHGKTGQNGAYFDCVLPASLVDVPFDQVKLTNYKDRAFLYGVKFFTNPINAEWSISSDLATLPSGTYVIPTTVTSATLNGGALDVSVPLDSYGTDATYCDKSGIASGAFEIIGEFDGPRTVSNFIIRGHWKYSQYSDFMVSLRKAETGEWVTITPHGKTGQNGAYFDCVLPDSLSNEKFDQVKLTNYKDRATLYGVQFFSDSLPTGWSAWSDLILPTDSYVIPITPTTGNTTSSRVEDPNSAAEINWFYLPLDSFGEYCYLQDLNPGDFLVAGKFEPTTVSGFMFKTHEAFPERAQFRVSLRKAGTEEWVEIAPHTLSGYNGGDTANGDKGQYVTYGMPASLADQEFDRVILTKDTWQWVQLYGVLFFTKNETGLHSVSATAVDSSDPFANTWGYSNATEITAKPGGTGRSETIAELATATVIHSIQFTGGANGNRLRQATVWASVDGSNWEQIAQFATSIAAKRVVDAVPTSEKAYKYVKVTSAWDDSNLSIVGIAVYGWTAVSMEGYQTKIDSSTYSVRFVSTVKGLGHEGVGYEITATGDGVNKPWDVNDSTVYSTIYETKNGVSNPVDAPEGRYFYVADVTNISIANYGEIAFTITPYVISNGTKLYGEAVTWTFEDGVFVNPQA